MQNIPTSSKPHINMNYRAHQEENSNQWKYVMRKQKEQKLTMWCQMKYTIKLTCKNKSQNQNGPPNLKDEQNNQLV